MLPRGTHDYEKFIKPSELASWARPAGLSLQSSNWHELQPNYANIIRWATMFSVNYLMQTIKA